MFRTDDFGATWTALCGPKSGLDGYALVVEQDPVDPNLLFVGTEFGLFVSQNGGTSYWKWTHGVPTTSVMDLCVHPRDHDLVLGTHGRAAFVIDDITPLREIDHEVARAPLHLCSIRPAQKHRIRQTDGSRFPGQNEFRGSNPRYGAHFDVWVGRPIEEDDGEEALITIERSIDGTFVCRYKERLKEGLNRVYWQFGAERWREAGEEIEEDGHLEARFAQPGGAAVSAGDYFVRIRCGDDEVGARFAVMDDPREPVSVADREAMADAMSRARALHERLLVVTEKLEEVEEDLDATLSRAEDELDADARKALDESGKELREALDPILVALRGPAKPVQGIRQVDTLRADVGRAIRTIWGTVGAPSPSDELRLARAAVQLRAFERQVDELWAGQVARFAVEFAKVNLPLFRHGAPLPEDQSPGTLPSSSK